MEETQGRGSIRDSARNGLHLSNSDGRVDQIEFEVDGMVGASGFEPPTSWSRTRRPRQINNLGGVKQ